MPLQIARPSLCLFCALAGEQSPRRFRPLLHVARRSTLSARPLKHLVHDRANRSNLSNDRSPMKYRSDELFLTMRLSNLRAQLDTPESLARLNLDGKSFDRMWQKFERDMVLSLKNRGEIHRKASEGPVRLDSALQYNFYSLIYGNAFTKAELEQQRALADLRYPGEWYPMARLLRRKVILHVGPTNSGKTYHALKRLEEAGSGVYLGPLRLLAHEVYTRMNAKGIPCSLITGEEQRIPEDQECRMQSCTVEMAPLQHELDVAVIDEIQMLNHPDRGWAWTGALLGLRAKEIHVCGEERAVPIIREICALVGDDIEIHRYSRLTPLQVADSSLRGSLKTLQKGDCIVSFSVIGIHQLRRKIEKETGRKVAIVYGSLPPETRAQQAKLFNDPDNEYDFLVASDAIGMGLNLNIKRVIFEAMSKSNGHRLYPLTISEVKQIAGRAGRYKTAHEAVNEDTAAKSLQGPTTNLGTEMEPALSGVVESSSQSKEKTIGFATTLDAADFPMLGRKMSMEPEPITTAGIFPPTIIIERFANYFPPDTPVSYILLRLHEIAGSHPRWHFMDFQQNLAILDAIHSVKNLTIIERLIFSSSPASMKDPVERQFTIALAQCVAKQTSGDLLDLPFLPLEVLDEKPSDHRMYLWRLEQLHKCLILYLWLSYRFPHIFHTRALAERAKLLTENAIEHCLTEFTYVQPVLMAKKKKPTHVLAPKSRFNFEKARSVLLKGPVMNEGVTGTVDYNAAILPENRVVDSRFGEYGSVEEIAAVASGYSERVQLLKKNTEDVVRAGTRCGMGLGIDTPVPAEVRL